MKSIEFYINNIKLIDPYAAKQFNGFKPLIEEIYNNYVKSNIIPDDYLNINCENCLKCWGCNDCKNCIN